MYILSDNSSLVPRPLPPEEDEAKTIHALPDALACLHAEYSYDVIAIRVAMVTCSCGGARRECGLCCVRGRVALASWFVRWVYKRKNVAAIMATPCFEPLPLMRSIYRELPYITNIGIASRDESNATVGNAFVQDHLYVSQCRSKVWFTRHCFASYMVESKAEHKPLYYYL